LLYTYRNSNKQPKGNKPMQIFFKSRNALRAFNSKNGKKTDNGAKAVKRWAFVVGKKGE
jgi:hypothetical protein